MNIHCKSSISDYIIWKCSSPSSNGKCWFKENKDVNSRKSAFKNINKGTWVTSTGYIVLLDSEKVKQMTEHISKSHRY